MISLIVAMDRAGLIGLNGALPWHRPEDLKNFRKLTLGHTVVMGRKTFESIGRPLRDRLNIVMSREGFQYEFDGNNPIMFTSIDRCMNFLDPKHEVFVIGGMQVYKAFASVVDRLYLTIIDQYTPIPDENFEAVYFPWPAFSPSKWACIEQRPLGRDFYYVYERLPHASKKEKDLQHPT